MPTTWRSVAATANWSMYGFAWRRISRHTPFAARWRGTRANADRSWSRQCADRARRRERSGRDRRRVSLNYRHAFHAGNFADVLKHAILARVLVYLARKERPFR